MESLNSMQRCVVTCRCVDLSEERPSRISKRRICSRSPQHGASGLVPDAEQESALKHTWVSASEGENGLTRAPWRHRSVSASQEDPPPGAAQAAHRWVGIREGRGPAVLAAQREGFRSPLLTCSGLRHTLQESVTLSSIQFSLSVVPDSLQPHESQHARYPCPSPTPRVHSISCP